MTVGAPETLPRYCFLLNCTHDIHLGPVVRFKKNKKKNSRLSKEGVYSKKTFEGRKGLLQEGECCGHKICQCFNYRAKRDSLLQRKVNKARKNWIRRSGREVWSSDQTTFCAEASLFSEAVCWLTSWRKKGILAKVWLTSIFFCCQCSLRTSRSAIYEVKNGNLERGTSMNLI